MSVQALSCAFAIRGISASEKLVLLALANFANDKMQCWPSQDRLAADTELSARTVWGALKALEDKGVVERTVRTRQDGSRTTDIFTLRFASTVWAEPLAEFASRGRKDCEGASQDLREGLAAVATLTTFEPSTKPSSEPVEVAASATPAKRRLRLVPDGWSPAEKVVGDLVGQGFAPGEIERELASFRNHEFREPKSDFDRAFRKWMINSRTFAGPRHERPHPDRKYEARQANYAAAERGADSAARQRWRP